MPTMSLEFTPIGIKTILSIAIAVVIYTIMLITIRIINRRVDNLKRRHTARKATLYIATLLAIIIITIMWMQNLRMVSVVISVIGAGLVVALGDVFLSIAGWFLVLVRRPFEAGDRVQIGDVKGDVIDIRLFQTSLLEIGNWVKEDQSTGRVVHISNSRIFKEPIYNFTRGFEFLWDEIKIIVTFESNWKKAQEIMLRHAQSESEKIGVEVAKRITKMAEKYFIYYDKLTPIVYVNIADNGVEISLRYLTEVKKRRQCRDSLNRAILDDFEKERDITFAYPTYRIIR
ncbi:mechanosensitive ion channel family protein [Omnitrophica bacterium]|nr:mechanosensitive ion channel family protein [Candidatus Omnitrophota bacterium]